MSEESLTQEDLNAILVAFAEKFNARQAAESAANKLLQSVRRQHFLFVHQYLEHRLTWESDNSLEDLLCSEMATERLRELWLSFGEKEKAIDDELIPADGLECFRFFPNDEHRGVIIRFPEPERPGEAYFAAILFAADPKYRDLVVYYRYFILELGFDLEGSRPVLCERHFARHYNYGDGCEPQKEAFEELIKNKFFAPGMPMTQLFR